MKSHKRCAGWFAILTVLVLLLRAPAAWAGITGSISGTIKDPTGATLADAQVTVTNTETNVGQSADTNALGSYSFLALPAGRYRLQIKKLGFETVERTNITLNANDALRLDAVLTLGKVASVVNVSVSDVHVETTNTQVGDVVDSNTTEALPLNGRNFTDLLGLQPGVLSVNSGITGTCGWCGQASNGNVSINGHRETANGFMVNGGNVDEDTSNGTSILPNLDSIAEFRVITSNVDAEYGHYSGGVVSIVTKSGTNRFHGSGFEFLRNTAMDATQYFADSVSVFRQNQFGGTLGGPIKRDKVFFFADYQGTRQAEGIPTGLVLVPSLDERNGDFADATSSLTGTVSGTYWAGVLSQRLGYLVTPAEPYFTSGCTATSQCVFPNAVVPQSAFSAPAKALLQYIPTPNDGSFFSSSADIYRTQDDHTGLRMDGNSSRWGMLSAYYFFDRSSQFKPFGVDAVPGFPTSVHLRPQYIILSDTKSFGTSAVNDFHFSLRRLSAYNDFPQGGLGNLSSLGFNFISAAPALEGVPTISFNEFTFGLPSFVFERFETSPQVANNFAKTIGTHTFKFGGEYHYQRFHQFYPVESSNGIFSFTGSETGNEYTDYLIGAPSGFIQGSVLDYHSARKLIGFYGQDTWHVRQNLVVNYGLRWDWLEPWYEAHNEEAYTYVLGEQSKVFPGAPQGYVFAGDTLGGRKIPSTISPTPKTDFAPRIGLAYSPSASTGFLRRLLGSAGQTSIRASYGIFFTNIEGLQVVGSGSGPPYGVYYESAVPTLFEAPYTNRVNGTIRPSSFPFTPPQPGSTNINWQALLPLTGIATQSPYNVSQYAEDYYFMVQREFASNTLLNLSYVGSQGHHLPAFLEENPGNPQLCLSLNQPSDVAPGTPTCGPFGENGVYTRPNGTIVNSTRGPFGPNFGFDQVTYSVSNSAYNSLQVSLRRTFGGSLVLASYTFSKSLDNASDSSMSPPLNPFNPRLSRGLSSFDSTHNFVLSYTYLLPFEHLGGNRWPRLASGWRLVGITRFATGFPIALSETDDRSLDGEITNTFDTPNFLGGKLHFNNPRSGKPYFDTSRFTEDQLGHQGNADNRFFHGPGLNNFDLALLKDLTVTERIRLQCRAEFFNVFNHAQFTVEPTGSTGLPTSAIGTFNSSTFGFATNVLGPRVGQVGIKLAF